MELPQDIQRFMLAMGLLVPLSYPLRWLPKWLRYWYSVLLGFVLQIYVYRDSMYPVFLQHAIVFALLRFKGPRCGRLVTFQSVGFLSLYHFYDLYSNYGGWSMNAVALLMVLVCKYSLLAYNLEDGADKEIHSRGLKDNILEERLKFRITEPISFKDFIGYINFLPTAVMGPPIEYRYYREFMDDDPVFQQIPLGQQHLTILKTVGETALLFALYAVAETYFPISAFRTPEFYSKSFWWILIYVPIPVSFARAKYYAAWKMSMCAVHASGLSWQGKSFHRVNTCNPWQVESSPNARHKINHWNMAVQEWLRKVFYQRNNFKTTSGKALYVLIMSAFWHGFYVAYYFSFFFWFLHMQLQTNIYKASLEEKKLHPDKQHKESLLHKILNTIVMEMSWNHCAVYFLILTGSDCIKMLTALYGLPQILLVIGIIYYRSRMSKLAKLNKKKAESEGHPAQPAKPVKSE